MKRTIQFLLSVLFTLCLVCALLTVTALAAPGETAALASDLPGAEPNDGETEPSYTLVLPESVTVTQNDVYTAVPVSVTSLNMVTGSDGLTPTFLRLYFKGLTLTERTDSSKTISCQLRKNSSDTPSTQKMYNVTATGSYGVEIVIPAAAWESAAPGIYTGSIEYGTMWRYSNNTWSYDLETGTIPVTAIVSEADPVITFDLNGSEFYTTSSNSTVLHNLEYFGVTPEPQHPGPGGLAVEPPEPAVNSPDNWIRFVGWYTDQACTAPFDFDAPVVESRTLYAKWLKDQEYFAQKNNGLLFFLEFSEGSLDAYAATGDAAFLYYSCITDFDLIEGLDYDPENKVLTFNGYDGYLVRIYDYGCNQLYDYDDTFVEIRVEGVNNIQLPCRSSTSPYITYPIRSVSFTGDGTINLNAKAGEYDPRQRYPWPIALFQISEIVTWDGPTLNVTGASLGINLEWNGWEPSEHIKMLSGEINIEITPADEYYYGAVARVNRLELVGGSLHVHYVKDLDAITSRNGTSITVGTISTGPHPVLLGLDYETYISPDFDFQITVDQELTDLGFSAYPFDAEDFVFSYLDPEYINNYYEGIPDQADFIGDPIPDINQVPGLSYDYDHYTGLDDELPHTLVLENYSGPGLFARSLRYPFTRLDIEVRGENTIYCNGYAGLAFDDLDVHFTGDGVLRFVSVDTGERRSYNTGDEYIFLYALSQSGISWVYDSSNAVEECPPSVTVEGPTLIFDGYYHKGALYELKNVTVLSGSISMNARHCPINASEQNPIPAKYTATIDSVFRDYAYNDVYEGVFLLGGETVINFQPSPIHTDVFRLKNNGDPGLCLMWLKSEPICAADTLLLVGEERVLRFDDYLYEKDLNDGSGDFTHFTATNIRKIQTAEAEGGRALVRAEGGKAIVTFEPEPGMEPVSLSYVADNGDPVDIPRGPDGWAFEYPVAQVITITPVFEPMQGYYLIGPDWREEDIDLDEKFAENPEHDGEYMLNTTLAEGDQIKVVYVLGGVIDVWYPDGYGTEYTVDAAHSGDVTIYFKPVYDSAWAEFGGYFYIAAEEPSNELDLVINNTLALEGATTLNYFVSKDALDAYELDSFKLVVVHTAFVDGAYVDETVELLEKGELYGGSYYWFEYKNIAAKELNDKMVAHVEGVKDGVTFLSQGKDYNPMTYCYTIAQRPTANAALRKTCADMIKYCAAAQICFSYNTANPADADWNDDIAAVATQGEPVLANHKEDIALEGQTAAIKTYTLDASGRVNINYYVLPDSGVDYTTLTLVCTYKDVKGNDVTTEIPGADWSFFNATYGYMATLNTVNAGEMREIITAVVQDANGSVISNTYKTSIETYAWHVSNNSSNTALIALMKAMLNYGTSARAFLA